jgi:TolB protein
VDFGPSWSPDGTRIAFTSHRAGSADIWVMNADGSNPVQLTTNGADDVDPAWSPDGAKIAFASRRNGNLEIYVMSADGSNQTRLTISGEDDIQPAWSPDGLKLVFARIMWCYYGCDYDLAVINADGSGRVDLPTSTSDLDAAWSPDGRWIAFSAMQCDYYYGCWYQAVQAMKPDGSGGVELVPNAVQPAWRRP